MSLYWPAQEGDVVLDKPRLHVFIVGVAHYPHLPGGGAAPAANPLQLGQVTTPQYTAARMAEWFEKEYRNPGVPLGSIELLISRSKHPPATATQPVMAADPATLANIRASFKRWQQRAASDAGNIAVFYFCGHGVRKVNHFLLAEDWGDPALEEAWANTIDFDGMRIGMRKCRARTQLFFVDACQETNQSLLKEIPTGERFISSDESTEVPSYAVYNASADKQQAFGPPDGPTYFSQALIDAFRIGAEHQAQGSWIVDTYSLSNAIGKVMKQLRKRYGYALSCRPEPSGEPVTLHHADVGSVLVVVGCSTPQADTCAEIVISNGHVVKTSPLGQRKPMYEVVQEGDWAIDVNFPQGQFRGKRFDRVRLIPPIFEGVQAP